MSFTQSGDDVTIIGNGGTNTFNGVERFVFRDGEFVNDPGSVGPQIQRLYYAALDRTPWASAISGWLAYFDHYSKEGTTVADIADLFASSAEFTGSAGTLSDSAFAEFILERALDRTPTQSEIDRWSAELRAGASRGDVLLAISESPEHRSLTADWIDDGLFVTDPLVSRIALYYNTFANRLPDRVGLEAWVKAVEGGEISLHGLADRFADSLEFSWHTEGKSDDEIVELLYLYAFDGSEAFDYLAEEDKALVTAGEKDFGDIIYDLAANPIHALLVQGLTFNGVEFAQASTLTRQ